MHFWAAFSVRPRMLDMLLEIINPNTSHPGSQWGKPPYMGLKLSGESKEYLHSAPDYVIVFLEVCFSTH